jgi:hypothetical protein
MKRLRLLTRAAVLTSIAVASLASGACGGGSDETVVAVAPTSPPSTLTVRWSVLESFDPNACVATSSRVIEITIVDATGALAGTFHQDCQAFSTSITLAASTYQGSAILLDASNVQRTTPVSLGTIQLLGNDVLVVDVDFPGSSFFQ